MCACIYIYIYICILEREREREIHTNHIHSQHSPRGTRGNARLGPPGGRGTGAPRKEKLLVLIAISINSY